MIKPKSILFVSISVALLLCLPSPLLAAQYSGDIIGYCKSVSDISGGSYSIEKGCREMENDAREKLSKMTVPQRILQYCKEVADISGKSYSIMVGCIEMELEAKNKL